MRIVLIGQGPFGEKVLESLLKRGEEVCGVFSTPDKKGEPLKEISLRYKIPIYQPSKMKDPKVYEILRELRPELIILAFVTEIIPDGILKIPAIGTICYHPSLLPKHRGASAINWAIIQGDKRTGLTIFWVEKGIDTGPILIQKEVEISPDDTAGSLYFNHLFPMGVEAIMEAIDLIKKGDAPKIPQNESEATYEPPCDDKVAHIDFNKPVKDIYNLIRGCDPQPGAYTFFKDHKIRLYDAKKEEKDTGKLPGEVISINDDAIEVALKDGVIKIRKLRIDKGEKIDPKKFVTEVNLKVGDHFGKEFNH